LGLGFRKMFGVMQVQGTYTASQIASHMEITLESIVLVHSSLRGGQNKEEGSVGRPI